MNSSLFDPFNCYFFVFLCLCSKYIRYSFSYFENRIHIRYCQIPDIKFDMCVRYPSFVYMSGISFFCVFGIGFFCVRYSIFLFVFGICFLLYVRYLCVRYWPFIIFVCVRYWFLCVIGIQYFIT